jgi:hypothetical protein
MLGEYILLLHFLKNVRTKICNFSPFQCIQLFINFLFPKMGKMRPKYLLDLKNFVKNALK